MSGNTILKDGRSINENYGTDLDKLEEDDRVGVVRTSNGDLVFYVNGVSSNKIVKYCHSVKQYPIWLLL